MILAIAISVARGGPPTPLAVVERGHAWVGVSCEAQRHEPVIADVPWSPRKLMLLTPTTYKTASFVGPTCVRGECQSDEVGVLVGAADDVGVLLDATYAAGARVTPLSESTTCPDEKDGTHEGTVRTCRTYKASADAAAGIQVRASGRLQENGWTRYTTIEWRTIDASPSAWVAVSPPYGTSVPRPIGRISSDSRQEIVWLSQEGICCPSASKAWVTYRTDGAWADGLAVTGGKGQPCD